MKNIVTFTTENEPVLSEIGGKAYSLILSTQKGLPVPPGLVLSVSFFADWLASIQKSTEWKEALSHLDGDLKTYTDEVKKMAMELQWDPVREIEMKQAFAGVFGEDSGLLTAVRSSSPEEDLEGASFAGGYETILGVKKSGLKQAVQKAFASCLDERILKYKQEKGFAVDVPRIAVIIQKQIVSDTSGVAFSINPLNNCYDEAVINANYGLGESVVAGIVTPDQYIVDKLDHTILERKCGSKKSSIRLKSDGGTETIGSDHIDKLSLSDDQVIELTGLLTGIEDYYELPIDIEWAYEKGKLYLLQARPVTAYIPLPEVMITKPGDPKKLYLDHLIVKQGIQGAFSVLGEEYLLSMQKEVIGAMMGNPGVLDPEKGIYITAGGRSYRNISHSMKVFGRKKTEAMFKTVDTTAVKILQNIEDGIYLPAKLPRELKGTKWGLIKNNIGSVKGVLKAVRNPDLYHQMFIDETERFKRACQKEFQDNNSLSDFSQQTLKAFSSWFLSISGSTLVASELKRAKIDKLFKKESKPVRDKLLKLGQALPNNVTIEMGLAMYKLAMHPDLKTVKSGEDFANKVSSGQLSADFFSSWDNFLAAYGHRCPRELDLATERYHENPAAFFKQLKILAENTNPETNPKLIYEKGIKEREEAYKELLEIAEKRGFASKFSKAYHVLEVFGGYRESHKYYFIMILDLYRRKIRKVAAEFVKAGRLDKKEDIFHLKESDIEAGLADPDLDLRKAIGENTVFYNRVKHIKQFPRIIDSRGKIHRAPRQEVKDGELSAEPISPGVVRGRIKVLQTPDEKPLLPGEIMVTRATDPGWTPLFLNAGGIILEVGGLLQHGALVAREYCKPCVAGVTDIFSFFKDGQMIEMDGENGIIRFIDN